MFMPRPERQPYALYGVAMLSVIVLWRPLSIMAFKQDFTDVTPVTMQIQRAGLQLLKGSDVKMRGLIVGDVGIDRQHRRRRDDLAAAESQA